VSGVGFLKLAGMLSAIIGVFHLVIIFVGAPAYRYFGAGEKMAQLAERGSMIPTLVTLGLTVLFAVWSAYAFAGGGIIPRLPLQRFVLVAVGVVYTLRGILVGPQLVWFFSGYRAQVPPRQLFFSLVALLSGLAYLAGTRQAWGQLGQPGSRPG
jgi:hypothetical protein